MKSIYRTILAVAGSFLAAQFGGWDAALETLVCFMAIDWITGGVLLPVVFKKSPKSENGTLESRAGWKGLCRKDDAVSLCWSRKNWISSHRRITCGMPSALDLF